MLLCCRMPMKNKLGWSNALTFVFADLIFHQVFFIIFFNILCERVNQSLKTTFKHAC